MHQIVTWNDFGEGTIIEPTLEFGFDYLVRLAPLTGGSTNLDAYQQILDEYLESKSTLKMPSKLSLIWILIIYNL